MFWLKAYLIFLGLFSVHLALGVTVQNDNDRYADIVIEPSSGRVLHATNATSLRHPASLTKMMTLYMAFKALKEGRLKLDQQLPVSANAAGQEPTKLGLKSGQTISVKDAIMSIATLSANDSAVVLAEALGGSVSDFGRAMTQQAFNLGMKQTHFDNPSGLPDPYQMTTAYDMAKLASALIQEFPEYYPYFSLKNYSYGGALYHNHNHLMDNYPGMDGIKTGYIHSSGFNLVASAKHGDTRLIGVVFGGTSPATRNERMAQLLNEGFATIGQGGHANSN
ncbi:MAG: D-alanyl-D-alanine carboxypeptidase [Proteobacteria bacterium]|nr:D-alanyl-D-alanine carboxypeptidase [Pseudomonadota bacterium]